MQMFRQVVQAADGRESPPPAQHRGLGLLGAVIAMAVMIVVLVALVGGASWVRKSGREMMTQQTLAGLSDALAAYRQATGKYPPAGQSNADLLRQLRQVRASQEALEKMPPPAFRQTATGQEILDAWSRPVRYVFDSASSAAPELFSEGPDSQRRDDDIYAELPGPDASGSRNR